jgi:dTDP-4-dehydrorhamnose reductase
MNKNIVVLGSDGMVGHIVFLYLHTLYPTNVFGTTRHKRKLTKNIFYLTSDTYKKDFAIIFNKIEKIDYVINCIGLLDNNSAKEELISVNSLFPHFLEKLSFKLIHLSTDAVFPSLAGKINESSPVGPEDFYSSSKLLGETTALTSLTIRSSFIGLDSLNHKGLLETVKQSKNTFPGFTNQIWTGCTTLQLAQFCHYLVTNNNFDRIRKKTNIIHFAPLGPVSKYTLIKTFSRVAKLKILIKKATSKKRKRILITNYFDLLKMNKYTSTIRESIEDLLLFEMNI